MERILNNIFMIAVFYILLSFQTAYAQDQGDFPFDNACLKYDKANFKVGEELLDVMKSGDFPQFCVLYSLSNYHIKQKKDDGYFIIGPESGPRHTEETMVFLKSKVAYQKNKVLVSKYSNASKPTGLWAYFIGPERFSIENGEDKEYYTFQEIDF